MKFDELLTIVGDEPLFETGLLLAGDVGPDYVRRQLSEWVATAKLLQVRRGLYAPAEPYRRGRPHPFVAANQLIPGSYVSLQTALAFYHLIPEHVPGVTSVAAHRPGTWRTPFGVLSVRRVKPALLFGYEHLPVGGGQSAFVAEPAKALLDLVYLEPGGDTAAFLAGLRLQNLDSLDSGRLRALAAQSGQPKLRRAAERIVELAAREAEEYQTL